MKVTLKQFRDGKMKEAILAAEPPEETEENNVKEETLRKGRFFVLGVKSPMTAGNGAEIGEKGREMGEEKHLI